MADQNVPEIEDGSPWERIVIEPTPDSYESFVGSRNDLIAAGICTAEQFPLPPQRTLSYKCRLGRWVSHKVKGGYRHQVWGREAMARSFVMERMKQETEAAAKEFARQVWVSVSRFLPFPNANEPLALPTDARFAMTEQSRSNLWNWASILYREAQQINIDPASPAFDPPSAPKRPTGVEPQRPALTILPGGRN